MINLNAKFLKEFKKLLGYLKNNNRGSFDTTRFFYSLDLKDFKGNPISFNQQDDPFVFLLTIFKKLEKSGFSQILSD